MISALLVMALQDPQVDRAIRDLGSDDPETREKATKTLRDRGRPAIQRLKAVLEKTDDPEVAARLRVVLDALDPWSRERLLATIPKGVTIDFPAYDVAFSEAGTSVAYAAGGRVYVGDAPGESFRGGVTGPIFLRDGRVTYRGEVDGRQCIVVGAEKGPLYDMTSCPLVSPDGSSVAYYAADRGVTAYLVVDGKAARYRSVGIPVHNADGVLACPVEDAAGWWMILGKETLGPFEKLGWAAMLTSDRKAFVYTMEEKGKTFLVRGQRRASLPAGAMHYSQGPDEEALAYSVKRGDRWHMVVKGREGEGFDSVFGPVWSPDGTRVAFQARTRSEGREENFVVEGERKSEAFDQVFDPAFTPDGKVVFQAAKGGKRFLVVDGVRQEEFAGREVTLPVFSPDGKVMSYAADTGKGWCVIAGSKKSDLLHWVWRPRISPDGKRVGFGARSDSELWWRVMDVP